MPDGKGGAEHAGAGAGTDFSQLPPLSCWVSLWFRAGWSVPRGVGWASRALAPAWCRRGAVPGRSIEVTRTRGKGPENERNGRASARFGFWLCLVQKNSPNSKFSITHMYGVLNVDK